MQPYSRLKRLAVLAARDAGKSTSEVVKKYDVSPSWVRRVVQQRRELGVVPPGEEVAERVVGVLQESLAQLGTGDGEQRLVPDRSCRLVTRGGLRDEPRHRLPEFQRVE